MFYEEEAGLGLPGELARSQAVPGAETPWLGQTPALPPTPEGVCWSEKVTAVFLHFLLGSQKCVERGWLRQKNVIAP